MIDDIVVSIDDATVMFNLESEKTYSIKEFVIKALKGQILFQEFLALENISLQVKRGEAWGFVGANGAGKSTLLKLICGIIKPYKGSATANGRIAPLIELGAGFDTEMTARENIYLNGAILGRSGKQMKEYFDEIVEFSGIGDFLDVPIKNFSSGMTARLGFSVATIIKPDILVVDEILAVGDMAFQEKCKKRMGEMLGGGTTLLFVSHSTEQVKTLCDHALWLDHGRMRMTGNAEDVCDAYVAEAG